MQNSPGRAVYNRAFPRALPSVRLKTARPSTRKSKLETLNYCALCAYVVILFLQLLPKASLWENFKL